MQMSLEKLEEKMANIEKEDLGFELLDMEDEKKCRKIEEDFKEFLMFRAKYVIFVNKEGIESKREGGNVFFEHEYEINKEKLIDKFGNKKIENAKSFIIKICSHFNNKYNCKIDSEIIINQFKTKVNKKYGTNNVLTDETINNLNYQDIISVIIENYLEGSTFKEAAINEIYDEFKSKIFNRKTGIKNDRIMLFDFLRYDYNFDDSIRIDSRSGLQLLFKVLSHFEYGISTTAEKYQNLYNDISGRDGREPIDVHDIICSDGNGKVSRIRLYKNGKVTIYFAKSEYASNFATNVLKI